MRWSRIKQRYPPVPDLRHQFGVEAHGLLQGELSSWSSRRKITPRSSLVNLISSPKQNCTISSINSSDMAAALVCWRHSRWSIFSRNCRFNRVNLVKLMFQQLFVLLQFLDGGLEQRPGHQQAQPGFPQGKPFFPFHVVFAILIPFEETAGFLHLGRRQVPDPGICRSRCPG